MTAGWEARCPGAPTTTHPTSAAARRYAQDEAEQRYGDLVDAFAWHPADNGEALWLRVDGAETESGWAIRPVSGGGSRG